VKQREKRVYRRGAQRVGFVLLISSLITLTVGAPAFAAVATVDLGTADTYSVLASTGVVNTLETSLSGDLGLSSSGTISGFPPGVVNGTTNDKNSAAVQAGNDRLTAYNDASGRTPTTTFSGDQNGNTFGPGVHSTAAAFSLTGEMILDGEGDSGAIFIFQVATALNTAAGSEVTLTGDALPENVFWQVNGAAGIGANSSFAGTILAAGAITLGAGMTFKGKALSGGTVTLIDDTVVTEQPSTSPSEPRTVSATAGNTSAVVSWSAPTSNGGSAITGYTVTSSPGGLTATTTSATTATVSGLTNGTPYTFRVVATNAEGGSPPSPASVAVTPATVPGPPATVTATAGNTSAVVSWSAPTSNGGSAITGYTVTSSPGGLTATTTSATTATVSGLTNGTPYTFRVVATNAVGGSPPSPASVAVTPAAASSPAPTPAPTPAPEGSTVDGGVLPDTGPNDWLIALGVGLAIALGAALLLLRARKSH